MRWRRVSSRSGERAELKAYHVYSLREARDPVHDTKTRALELITHMYSCLTHKEFNPDIPLGLIADSRTVEYFSYWNITNLYDEIVTDIFDDYPRERVSPKFWASPKLWAMSKLSTPFVIFDTDIVLQKPLADYADCDVMYLHREFSAQYPNIFDVTGPSGFVWGEEITKSFLNTQPMNCAVVGMFNETFKSDYVRAYFDFVLNSTGELQFANENSHLMYAPESAQILMEQWFLAALAEYWNRVGGRRITCKAFCKVISGPDCFKPLDLDLPESVVGAQLEHTFYHLWGAKDHQHDKAHPFFHAAKKTLTDATRIVENSEYREILQEPFGMLIAALE